MSFPSRAHELDSNDDATAHADEASGGSPDATRAVETRGDATHRDRLPNPLSSIRRDLSHRETGGETTWRISHYELKREIGRGGFGIVFAAYDERLHRDVAVKIARAEVANEPKAIQRFQAEAQAAAKLDHPGIIGIFDCGLEGDLYYYVMPLLHGENLFSWLASTDGETDPHVVARLVMEISNAVHYGHVQGIIHRDLKPQNIMLKPRENGSSPPQPVVLDFGLCGHSDDTVATTTMMAGTPRYMSPEQVLFGNQRIDERSDIYSLGVVLYQLLTKRTPMAPDSFAEAVLMLHHASIESPRVHRPNLDPVLETIGLKCLRKDPERRYQSADELARDLQRFLDHETVSAQPESYWERIEFGLFFGPWERILGYAVVAVNMLTWVWAALGALVVGARYWNDPTVAATLPQFIGFVVGIALPLHITGVLAGWMMTRRTLRYRFLGVMALVSIAWALLQAQNLITQQPPLEIYRGRGVAMTLVFLVIAPAFAFQSVFLALGCWMARRRAFQQN